jgi:hypothetical protein
MAIFPKADFGGPTAVAGYALLPADKADSALQKQCREALLKAADAKVASISR